MGSEMCIRDRNKGYAAIVHQMDRISVNITESGKNFLLECRREDEKEECLKKIKELESKAVLNHSCAVSSEKVGCVKVPSAREEESSDPLVAPVPMQTEASPKQIFSDIEDDMEDVSLPMPPEFPDKGKLSVATPIETSPKQMFSDMEDFDEEDEEEDEICIKQTVYLIDSENVGNTWLGLISRLRENDELHVFYTDKSPTLTYETVVRLLEHDYIGMVNWIKCFTGENALDFQLVTELGSMIAEKRITGLFDPYFIILSRDRGYDPVVSYWTKKGVMVKRYPAYTDIRDVLNRNNGILEDDFSNCEVDEEDVIEPTLQNKKKTPVKKNEPYMFCSPTSFLSDETKRTLRGKRAIAAIDGLLKEKTWKENLEEFFSEKVEVDDPKTAAEYLIEMSRLVSVDNEEKYLHAIATQFGDKNGTIIMDEVRNNKLLRINLSNGTIKNMKIRRKDYIMLFLKNNDFLDPDIRSIAPLLQKPSRVPMENVKRLLLRYHNGTETQALINLIQKHLKVVKEIV